MFWLQVIPSMLKKLQLCVEQVHEVLDETTEQVLSSLPKVVNDIEQFENQATNIQQKIIDLKKEINTVTNLILYIYYLKNIFNHIMLFF